MNDSFINQVFKMHTYNLPIHNSHMYSNIPLHNPYNIKPTSKLIQKHPSSLLTTFNYFLNSEVHNLLSSLQSPNNLSKYLSTHPFPTDSLIL